MDSNKIKITPIIVIAAVCGLVFGYLGSLIERGQKSEINLPTFSFERPGDESDKVVSIVKKYSPGVVSIVASKDLPIVEQSFRNPFQDFCDDPFFRQFFGNCEPTPSAPPQQKFQHRDVSAGTGFIVRSDGLIVTNRHVVDINGADYTVILNNGKKYRAGVLARDPVQDAAILKIEADGLQALQIGDSDKLAVGQTVIAIGNALGQFSNSVSKGIVSGLARSVTAQSGDSSEKLDKVIQTDAAINPGNSGGPLLNLDGQVVGVNTAIVSGAQNVGFAIPINRIKKDINDIESKGKISYSYLGVHYVLVDSEVKDKYKLNVDYGALVTSGQSSEPAVVPNSPAAKAGIKENDVILEIDGRKIDAGYTLSEAVQNKPVGSAVSLKIKRGDSTLIIKVVLGEK